MIVVSDTGPLNYLLLIGRVDLLAQLFQQVRIPPAVMDELTDKGASLVVRSWATSRPVWALVQAPTSFIDLPEGPGRGERAAIALAKELNLPILSDDKGARHIARTEGLVVSGTLGVLVEAHGRGLLEISEALGELSKTSFYLSEDLVLRIIANAQQIRKTK